MANLPVDWSEGMFLRPHHFQAADRYWTEALRASEHWDHEYNYGVRQIEVSPEAIANFQFQLNTCHARMRDGTLVSLDAGQEPDRVDLKNVFATADSATVFLAVPKVKIGSVNVGREADSGKQRYVAQTQPIQDEGRGGNDQDITFRRLNVRVLLSTDDASGYELLPIAKVQRASDQAATPRLDPDYFPPMLAVDAWPPLGRDIVRAVYDIIGKKIEVLGEQVTNRSIGFGSQEPGDLDRLFMLSRLNEGYATLGVLAFAQGVHPREAYTELARLVGQLSVFDAGAMRRIPEIPRYDHDDLARNIKNLKERIIYLINLIRDYEYEQRFFVGEGMGMRVTLEPKWLNSDWQWYVGVGRGDLSETECRELLSSQQLDWKLGSKEQVEMLFTRRMAGLELIPSDRAPRALPASRDWLYYQVSRQNAAWKDVQDKQTLAMRLKDALIANKDTLQGERNLMVSFRGRQALLQFALFAVPIRS